MLWHCSLEGGGEAELVLVFACDSGEDVRDPAAEMTFVLSSCRSIPTTSPRNTAGGSDISTECV